MSTPVEQLVKYLEIVANLTVGSLVRQESAIPLHYLRDDTAAWLARFAERPRTNPGDRFDFPLIRPTR
jgi:hypothetical protein